MELYVDGKIEDEMLGERIFVVAKEGVMIFVTAGWMIFVVSIGIGTGRSTIAVVWVCVWDEIDVSVNGNPNRSSPIERFCLFSVACSADARQQNTPSNANVNFIFSDQMPYTDWVQLFDLTHFYNKHRKKKNFCSC